MLKGKRIGIPRAISYYNNYPFYYGFFSELGFEVVVSDKTTTGLINKGSECVVSDTCLPIKVYVGHVINLLEKGCDTIFVPSLQSTGYKINNCSKVRGLPEIIRNVVNRPFNMLEPTLDKTEGLGLKAFCIDAANQLGIYDEKLISSAMKKGWQIYNNFLQMAKSGITHQEAIKNAVSGKFNLKNMDVVKPLSVVIMGHGYNLFDERISMNILKKLEKMGVKVYTGLNVSKEDAISAIHNIGEIQYWANELDLTGAAAYYMQNRRVDGIIALTAFGCGPDSLMVDEIQYHARNKNIPMVVLTIDEHTGEAGFVTRLEAFIDMLSRRKKKLMSKTAHLKLLPEKTSEKKETKVLTRA